MLTISYARVLSFFVTIILSLSALAQEMPPDLPEKLKTEGLFGLVHGADTERGLYVFTWNKPGDFFTRFNFSLVGKTEELRSVLKTFKRGDQIHVQGELGGMDTPQPHIIIATLKLVQAHHSDIEAPAGQFERTTKLPDDLIGQTEMIAQVHAVVSGGRVLVVEYKDAILPVVVEAFDVEWTEGLYRGDVIRLQFEIQDHPPRPTHITLKSGAPQTVEVLERLVDRHGTTKVLEGRLVLFPKSPTINRDVWAIEEDLGHGLYRYSTLVNFEDEDGMDKIDARLRPWWNAKADQVFAGRNKFINLGVSIRAEGRVTVFDPNQANAQLNMKAEAITLLP